MNPYFQRDGITLYHADCREVLPTIEAGSVDLVLTDPPYPSYHTELFQFDVDAIRCLELLTCRQFVFWTPSEPFPLSYSGMRVWDKAVGTNTQFELIYERNNSSGYKVHRYYIINSTVAASFTSDTFTGHPSQKPIGLFKKLINDSGDCQTILDPFCGSGTTLRAAMDLGRKAIGIEISEEYCESAARRLEQRNLQFAEVM